MKLYQLQRDTRFKLLENTWGVGEEFTFDRVDGLYARCYRPMVDGVDEIYHMLATAEVEVINEETT